MPLKTIRVFEHETLAVGHPEPTVEGGERCLSESEFEALVRFNERTESPAFEVGHKRLKFRQFVGYIQVGDLGIEILPKSDRHSRKDYSKAMWHDALVEMLQLAGRLGNVSLQSASVSLHHESLLEVFVSVFLSEVERLLHEGLARAYRSLEENGNCYRGKLLVHEHLQANLTHAERFYVRRLEFDLENPPNCILRTALLALRQSTTSSSTRRRIERVWANFPEVSVSEFHQSDFDRLRLTRNTVRYGSAIELARLILLNYSPQLRAGPVDVFSMLFDMNALWEEYFAVVLKRAAPVGVQISTQQSKTFWSTPGQNRPLRPDIVIRLGGEHQSTVVIDTKWKMPKQGKPADGDLKQIFAYNELFRSPRGFLVYPCGPNGRAAVSGQYQVGEHRCEARYFSFSPAASELGGRVTPGLQKVLGDWLGNLLWSPSAT